MSLGTELKAAIKKMEKNDRDWADDLLDFLSEESQDIRIHDLKNGGVLWSANREHEYRGFATFDPKKLEREVVLSRAIFNAGRVNVGAHRVEFLSFEAPLLRRHSGRKGSVHCDVVAVKSKPPRLILVEVKCYSGDSLDLPYAILEAWSYGWLLHRYHETKHKELGNEILSSAKRYDISLGRAIDSTTWGIGFALAAPHSYFLNQREKMNSARGLLNLLSQPKTLSKIKFYGFWLLGEPNAKKEPSKKINGIDELVQSNELMVPDGKRLVPFLKSREIVICENINKLEKFFYIAGAN